MKRQRYRGRCTLQGEVADDYWEEAFSLVKLLITSKVKLPRPCRQLITPAATAVLGPGRLPVEGEGKKRKEKQASKARLAYQMKGKSELCS